MKVCLWFIFIFFSVGRGDEAVGTGRDDEHRQQLQRRLCQQRESTFRLPADRF